MTKNEIVKAINDRRKELGVAITELCVASGHVSTSMYCTMVRGDSEPKLQTIIDYCDVLGLEVTVKRREGA